MSYIPEQLKQEVRLQSNNRCEYCHLYQKGQSATFHIDHVVPVKADGSTTLNNLALACVSCSLRKAAKVSATDPETGIAVKIFNPRQDNWDTHFEWAGFILFGKTSVGRATVNTLKMNRPLIIEIRNEERFWGRHP